MIARWCISILVLGLTLFGVVSQQQISVPNQEIVLQFQDVDLTSNQTEHTVALVKLQLQSLGAENIQVLSLEDGKLKITYYSDADIASIKQTFSEENNVALRISSETQNEDSSSLPYQDSKVSYNLDVYEIQNGHDTGWGFDGAIGLEIEPKSDRYLDPNYLSVANIGYHYDDNLLKVAYKIRRKITIQLSDPLHSTPEVRAGPTC
ncbi:MAG: hypothetical protein P8K68_09025 [Algibacter sp.]|uniref:hypothetical protein n=1 Tax=Algibacter sp. TaxID=1872428 RepID=UPI0026180A80|nr:hypothetical protein [Algibacter sp.]MDG1730285.1 hypothetical protein [Algibacter sp.]MDG2178913.1 hypothetical protein [Algibacter sp.]